MVKYSLMLKIRLFRRGRKNAPCFDIVVAEARKTKIVEKVGYYKPQLKTENRLDKFNFNIERINYWISKGAHCTEIIEKMLDLYYKNNEALKTPIKE
jgi:ribosomal protein S16